MELEQAIQAVRGGDQGAFADIIEQTERRLRASLALQVADRDLVDEVAHQAYITAYQKINEYNAGTNFYAWLRRIAQFHLRNECRRRTHAGLTPLEQLNVLIAPNIDPTQAEETRDSVAMLHRCMEKLGPDARQLLQMRYEECMEPAEIAKQIGKGASHVRTILTRVRQSLMNCMEAQNA
jgi:RNA polymerase sigma-70 factor (ECF subfamily)